MQLSPKDLATLAAKGISNEKVENQINSFVKGFAFLPIERAAVVGDGIVRLADKTAAELSASWDKTMAAGGVKVEKFVPASGAATRMFKEYFEFVAGGNMSAAVRQAVENVDKFAFYDDLVALGIDTKNAATVVGAIIGKGLDYGAKPKALLKFHKYAQGGRTSCEEHLVEGALYGSSGGATGGATVNIHFTVSPEHRAGFEKLLDANKIAFEKLFNIRYNISYSEQKSSTDTIAVDMNNAPFRTSDNELLFRPAGHGALIENLNDISSDVIFVKTVDNVVPDHRKADTILYKKALAELGLQLQRRIFDHITKIDKGAATAAEVREFIEQNIGYKFLSANVSLADLRAILDRPLRVCGMVRNEGEPGGGPFWVKETSAAVSLQIAESSQIAPQQRPLMQQATHFNPVDLVCFTKNSAGKKFDLCQFVDPSTGFISEKSFGGRPLKAQELPGLWNGAMARWNTVFVEVPISTFAPVKVLTDLLRVEHQ